MNRHLHSILFEIWAMRPEFAISQMPMVHSILKGERGPYSREELSELRAEHAPSRYRMDGTEMEEPEEVQAAETASIVLRIPIQGTITKYGGMCNYGTIDYANWLAQAEADESIVGVLLDIDSGGGSGNGMNLLTDRMRRMKKPIVAITQSGMACSAAFGIGAHADEFYALLGTDEFGSVGTLTTLPNMKKYWATLGLDLHDIYASKSTDKNSAWMEALKADPNDPNDPHYKQLREEFLDPFNEAFIQSLKAARPDMVSTEKQWSTGKVYGADQAKTLGLIDGLNTVEGAIERIRELAKTSGNTNSRSTGVNAAGNTPSIENRETMNLKEKFASMIAGVKNLFTSDADVTAETLAAANAALKADGFEGVQLVSTERAKAIETAESQVKEAIAKTAAAEEKLTKTETDIASLTGEKAKAETSLAESVSALAEATKKIGELEAAAEVAKTTIAEKDATIAKMQDDPAGDGQPAGAKGGTGDADPAQKSNLNAEEQNLNALAGNALADMP